MQHPTGRPYRRARRVFKDRCRAERRPCHLCRQDIDYSAPPNSPDSFEVDHVIPLSVRPDLAQVTGNWAPAHSRCNRSRGAKDMPTLWVRPSW
jgi:5-methylcytosine-specific restriction endonuclease McrA